MKAYCTSEAVACGHPDKVCDQIADGILDAILCGDPYAKVACEVTACAQQVHIFGNITSRFLPDVAKVTRSIIRQIGYTDPNTGFDADGCEIRTDIRAQYDGTEKGVSRRDPDDTGASDQGVMVGYATDETDCLMPLPITLARRLIARLEQLRFTGEVPCLLPDGKAQITVEYDDGVPARIASVVLSAQHKDGIKTDALRETLTEQAVRKALPAELLDDETLIYINPTGRFVVGGPAGDAGLTGRKIIADTYGGSARHGGGSFSGKDAAKVSRSGAYLARYLAKNIVAAGLAQRCEVQLAYAIGLADPVSASVQTFGTGAVDEQQLSNWLKKNVDMRPAVIIRNFGLLRPIYRKLSCKGHFGENAADMPWEQTDLAQRLKSAFSAVPVHC